MEIYDPFHNRGGRILKAEFQVEDSTHGEIRLSGSIMEGILLKYARLLTAS
jgi:hypothetical protein